jgi:toxin-antitoxin system PIN domain toxin
VIVPDVNLLLYAYDDASPFHEKARHWWEQVLSGSEEVGLTEPVIFGFVRISTSTRAFEEPLSLTDASEIVTQWCNHSVTRLLLPDAEHVSRVLELLVSAASAGRNLVTDAQIASLAIAHGGTVYTADSDFKRFAAVAARFPLD